MGRLDKHVFTQSRLDQYFFSDRGVMFHPSVNIESQSPARIHFCMNYRSLSPARTPSASSPMTIWEVGVAGHGRSRFFAFGMDHGRPQIFPFQAVVPSGRRSDSIRRPLHAINAICLTNSWNHSYRGWSSTPPHYPHLSAHRRWPGAIVRRPTT
jgi:hypothetical protein